MDGLQPRINTSLLQALVAEGLVVRASCDEALAYAREQNLYVEEALLQLSTLDESILLKFQANHYRTQFVSTLKLARAPISESLLRLVPHRLAAQFNVFPVRYDQRQGELSILTVQPDDLEMLRHVQHATGVQLVRPLVARPAAINAAIRVHYQDELHAFEQIRVGLRSEVEGAEFAAARSSRRARLTTQGVAAVGGSAVRRPTGYGVAAGASMQAGPSLAAPVSHTQPYERGSEAAAMPAAEPPPPVVSLHDYLETLHVLVALLENGRGELRNHSVNVARLCRRFCERLDLAQLESDAIVAAAYLHDIGKTSAFHLTALNVAQYDQHRQQARKSYLSPLRILESVRLPDGVSPILTHLYDRFDGKGFPDRLTGKEICLGSRVMAIVETYVDLTGHTSNPFRRRLTPQEAWDALSSFRGKVFDPNLVDVFKSVVLGDDLRAKLLSGGRRALIVDGDAEETTVLELRLVEHGYEVVIARNAREALDKLTQGLDVVISEVDLLPFDGFSLLSQAREQGVTVPFVFLSRQSESEVVQRGFDLGADEFIIKPASPEVVALKVNRVLEAGRRRRPNSGISGSLSEMSLPDVVQILFHGRKTGRLTVDANGRRGEVHFCEGQIFEATYGEQSGEEAFYEMLCLTVGDFELDPAFQPTERRIELSPETMLLEGLRRLDESARHG